MQSWRRTATVTKEARWLDEPVLQGSTRLRS